MSAATKLTAEARESFGKGVARKLRAAGKTPVVLYGHGEEPKHLTIETHPLSLVVRHANALVELELADGQNQLALVKDVQKDPVRQIIEHVDLLIVKRGETVDVDVPVVLEGDTFPGTAALQGLNTLSVSASAVKIPETFVVSVEGLEEGAQVLAKDVDLEGATLITDPEEVVVSVVVPQEEVPEPGAEGAEDAAEGAEAAEPEANSAE